jgi:hypothetical protein
MLVGSQNISLHLLNKWLTKHFANPVKVWCAVVVHGQIIKNAKKTNHVIHCQTDTRFIIIIIIIMLAEAHKWFVLFEPNKAYTMYVPSPSFQCPFCIICIIFRILGNTGGHANFDGARMWAAMICCEKREAVPFANLHSYDDVIQI